MPVNKLTTEIFIERARLIHGDTYDYSLVYYDGMYKFVDIICPIHGVFKQRASKHLRGRGCRKCGIKKSRKKPQKTGATRICNTCGRELPRTSKYFYRNNSVSDGFSGDCKDCVREKRKPYNKAKWAKVIEERGPFIKLTKEEKKIRKKAGYEKWKANGGLKKCNEKKLQNKQYCIANNLRGSLWANLKKAGVRKKNKTIDYIGCSWSFLYSHIESQFKDGMCWENYNRDGWWIDHIRPCASFDLTDEKQLHECFHYSNLQPMWGKENIIKGSLFEGERYKRAYNKK